MTPGRAAGLALAGVMVAAGVVFTGQGLGYIGGSSMTDEPFWAIAGPVLAGLGVALFITVARGGGTRG